MAVKFRVQLPKDALPVTDETKAQVTSIFPRLCERLGTVEKDPRLFWCYLPGSYTAFAFGESFHVPLGVWAHAWQKGIGVSACPSCGGRVHFVFSNGALSGGWSSGWCANCGSPWSGREWSPRIWDFIRNDIAEALESGKYGDPSQAFSFEEAAEYFRRKA